MDTSGRIEGLEEPAGDKSAAVPEMPARDRGEIAKKEGVTSGDKFAGQDMLKTSLKAAKGAPPAAESATPTSSPAAGLAIQGQSQLGGGQVAQNINASEAPSQNQPAEPPAEKDFADRTTGKAASTDELLVVRCEITPEALKNHAFDKILADNAIVWSDTRKKAEKENLDFKSLFNAEAIQSLLGAKTGLAANKPEVEERSKDTGDNIALSTESGPLELVYVEASPAQIQSMLNGLSAKTETFKTVSVAPAKGDSRLHNAVADFKYRGVIAGAARGGRADVAQSVDSVNGGFQSDLKSDISSSAGAALGRAQRIPFSYGYNAKADGVETEAQQQNLTSIAQKGLPATMGYGGIGSAGRLGETRSGGQLGVAAGAAPSTGSGTAEQLKSSAQALNQSAAKAEQAPSAAASAQLFTNRNQGQSARQEDQPAPAAQSRQSAKQERQSASAAQNRQDADSQRRNLQVEAFGTAALPRIERVLFVLQVIERKSPVENAAENANKKAPADAAGVNVPAEEVNPSKP